MSGFEDADADPRPAELAAYLVRLGERPETARYKGVALAALDLEPGMSVLDVGAGVGVDLAALRAAVGPSGRVVGVDRSQALIDQAGTLEGVSLVQGDAEALPFPDGHFDVVRAERLLIHVADPQRVVHEMARVARPAGRIALLEPDWSTLRFEGGAPEVGAVMAKALASSLRQPAVGRGLEGLLTGAGLSLDRSEAWPFVLDRFAAAEATYRLSAVAWSVAMVGEVPVEEALAWLAASKRADEQGEFRCTLEGFGVVARKGGVE